MVNRQKTKNVVDTLKDLRRDHTELVRAVARGGPGLADASGNEVRLDPDSVTPKLDAVGQDVSMTFGPEGVTFTDPTGTQTRNVNADAIGADGNIVAGGDVIGEKFRGDLGGANDGYNGYGTWHGNVQGDGVSTTVSAGYVSSGGNIYAAQNINAGVSIAAALNVFDGVGNLRTQSERALKDPLGELDPAIVDRFVTGRFRFAADSGVSVPVQDTEHVPLDPDDDEAELVERPVLRWAPDEATHVGLYVDEMDEADPDLVRVGADGHRTFEDRGVLAYAIAALQELRRDRDDLAARVAALEGRR